MKKIEIDDEDDLIKYLNANADKLLKINHKNGCKYFSVENINFNYHFTLPLKEGNVSALNFHNVGFEVSFSENDAEVVTTDEIHFNDSTFEFKECDFLKSAKFGNKVSDDLTFDTCNFLGGLDLSDSNLQGKWKLKSCHFYEVNFFNATFHQLADFYRCYFHEKIIFLKTDFNKITVFAECVFYENTLFTYTLIEKLIVLRKSHFKKGLDLSLAIGDGKFNIFDLKPIGYNNMEVVSKEILQNEDNYENFVTRDAIITLKNQRETLRILKHTLIEQDNVADSLVFKSLEHQTLKTELKQKKKKSFRDHSNLGILNLNNWSNAHGVSYTRAFRVFLVAIFPFYFTMISADSFSACIDCEWAWDEGFGNFFQFLNPAHNVNYLGEVTEYRFTFYLSDFVGRLIVGYGIYQFIQAFRKYR